uniref:Tetratricopeptide repeat protein n=1 Tax=candidate division WOR-3 bacterium TaxID=2052148 RepID=A0A7C6EHD2_UNCW3
MHNIPVFKSKSFLYLCSIFFLCIQSTFLCAADDFYTALKNYENGNYRIAQIFFENFIDAYPSDTLIPDATYYLLKIYDKKDEFIKFLNLSNCYLNSFRFHQRRNEVFNLLLQRLLEKKTYALALDYIKKYDYIQVDTIYLNEIILNLSTWEGNIDELLRFSPGNDSLKILKALCLNDLNERTRIFKEIKGIKGKIYLIENYLLMGDTVSAYDEYRKIRIDEIPDEYLYIWAKLSLDFNKSDFYKIIDMMEGKERLKEKLKILSIFKRDALPDSIDIKDRIDVQILQKFFNIRHIPSDQFSRPEGIDSILGDTTEMENKINEIRKNQKRNFYLDSLYCEILLKKERYVEAYDILKYYLRFTETNNYARIIRALKLYSEKKYRDALKDLLLASFNDQRIKFIYAECLEYNNLNPESFYEELSKTASDSIIRYKSLSHYIKYTFQQGKYSAIAKIKPEAIFTDTSLTRYYLLSLIYTGKKMRAESLYIQTQGRLDKDFYCAEVQYYVDNNLLIKAQNLIDSLINLPDYSNDETLNYFSWFIPFRRGDYKIAEQRLEEFIKKFRNSKYYYSAIFKIGTLKYLNQEFDSSAYYYNLAAADSTLKLEALKNQMIALKKAERWNELIEASKKIIEICPDSTKSEYYFEIGYAYLRNGNIKNTIEYLKMAINLKPSVEYHFWLGEAFLGKGDFMRALYHYQKVTSDFKKDQMWYPTALFKSGLALEMMDEIREAKNVYRKIIKEFGGGDIWATEARKRLEQME